MAEVAQVVGSEGEYHEGPVENFIKANGIATAGVNYQVVAIMGPQSSGKSTLMNSVFGTSFTEMDALSGRHQTTKGIWLAKSPKIEEPATLVMDLEGSDGRERGEDDTSFERQSALFALAVADVLLVNMWAKDIGRESGSGKPLLKTIFQVNLKLFEPAAGRRRTVLLFVFRDRTRTPMARLIETWEEDLARIWAAITKPPHYEDTAVTDFFEVKYAALSNFEEKEEDFRAESVLLRKRFTPDGDEPLLADATDRLPGDALALSLHKVWEVVRSQKDLNLPAHKVMVANIRCAEMVRDQLQALAADQAWASLQAEAQQALLPCFGQRAAALADSATAGYDEEARYFEERVRGEKRGELVAQLQALVLPLHRAQLAHLQDRLLASFRVGLQQSVVEDDATFSSSASGLKAVALSKFEEGAEDLTMPGTDWDSTEAYLNLEAAIDSHVATLRQQKVAAVRSSVQKQLASSMNGPSISLLDSAPADLWLRLAKLCSGSASTAWQAAQSALRGYALSTEEGAALQSFTEDSARRILEAHVREASNTVLSRMKDRFGEAFGRDAGGLPRSWGPRTDIPAITHAARLAALRLLAALTLIRLDLDPSAGEVVDAALMHLADPEEASSSAADSDREQFDMMAAAQWPVPAEAVLQSPTDCRRLWRQFVSDTNFTVQQAISTQEANKAASNRMPPLWAALAIVVLGWNEFLTVLYNPLWLLILILLFLFGKTVYQELDVDAEMQRGLLPGALSLGTKFVPSVRSVARRTFDSCRQFVVEAPTTVQDQISRHTSPNRAASSNCTDYRTAGSDLRRRVGSVVEMTTSAISSAVSDSTHEVSKDK